MSLQLVKENVPDSVCNAFQNLNKFNEGQFVRLTEILFQFLLDPKQSEFFLEQLRDFSREHGMSFGPLTNLMKSVLLIPQGALKRNLMAEQVKEDLLTLGLNEDKSLHLSQQWSIHYAVLSRQAIERTLMVNQLVDMEWKFGVTIGTSEIQMFGNLFIQLKLVIRKGNAMETVYMELSLHQFYNFLHKMENAKASMDCFS